MIVLAKDLIAEAKEEKLKILEKCKIICIDFDFTAMIWTNRITEFGEERYNCFLRGENFYLKHAIGVPNPIIDKFLERYYKGTDKKLYLMSATEPFAEAMKVEYVNKMFNYKFENGCVHDLCYKADKLLELWNENKVRKDEILLIDDNAEEVGWEVLRKGFNWMTPQELAIYIL